MAPLKNDTEYTVGDCVYVVQGDNICKVGHTTDLNFEVQAYKKYAIKSKIVFHVMYTNATSLAYHIHHNLRYHRFEDHTDLFTLDVDTVIQVVKDTLEFAEYTRTYRDCTVEKTKENPTNVQDELEPIPSLQAADVELFLSKCYIVDTTCKTYWNELLYKYRLWGGNIQTSRSSMLDILGKRGFYKTYIVDQDTKKKYPAIQGLCHKTLANECDNF